MGWDDSTFYPNTYFFCNGSFLPSSECCSLCNVIKDFLLQWFGLHTETWKVQLNGTSLQTHKLKDPCAASVLQRPEAARPLWDIWVGLGPESEGTLLMSADDAQVSFLLDWQRQGAPEVSSSPGLDWPLNKSQQRFTACTSRLLSLEL